MYDRKYFSQDLVCVDMCNPPLFILPSSLNCTRVCIPSRLCHALRLLLPCYLQALPTFPMRCIASRIPVHNSISPSHCWQICLIHARYTFLFPPCSLADLFPVFWRRLGYVVKSKGRMESCRVGSSTTSRFRRARMSENGVCDHGSSDEGAG